MTRADAHGLRGLFQRVEKPRLSGLLSGWPRHVTPSVRSVPAADFPPPSAQPGALPGDLAAAAPALGSVGACSVASSLRPGITD